VLPRQNYVVLGLLRASCANLEPGAVKKIAQRFRCDEWWLLAAKGIFPEPI